MAVLTGRRGRPGVDHGLDRAAGREDLRCDARWAAQPVRRADPCGRAAPKAPEVQARWARGRAHDGHLPRQQPDSARSHDKVVDDGERCSWSLDLVRNVVPPEPALTVSIAWMSEETNSRVKDGVAWRIGTEDEVAWIREGTSPGVSITSAIPPGFAEYATLTHPGEADVARDLEEEEAQDRALLAVLQRRTASQPWWLGYLETGASDIVFWDAPRVILYSGWSYVLVGAGPEQAASWRPAEGERNWKSTELPELMFPTDRSWLVST